MEIKTYDLSIDVDYAALTYSGRVRITLVGATQDLTLNSVGLKIRSVSAGGKPLRWEEKAEAEELVLHDVPSGATMIDLEFDGKAAEKNLVGFYRSRFDGGYILTTQFEATDARRFFPCLDHPAYKAVFNVEFTVAEDLKVIFNTPVEKETKGGDGKKVLRFQPTPRMSTYLLYVGIGKFAEVERTEGKFRVIVALPEEKRPSATYALEHAGKIIKFYEKYYDVPYPLPKMHLVAVPDFWAGAMENWGAITFREGFLLVDEGTSASVKKMATSGMSHEIAHQWFGDLVTMSWWNDLWLNESFATFMSYKAVHKLHPEWEVWSDFHSQNMTPAFLWDALTSTHPIETKVVSPSDINQIGSAIIYNKGGSVLRMVEAYVGEDTFSRGVSAYLKKFQYGNASGEDLWRAIEETAKVPVVEIMEKWIRKEGYPIITARLKGNSLHLEQARFLLKGREPAEPWPIPIVLRVNGKTQYLLMERKSMSIEVGPRVGEVLLNSGRTGFYRVSYGRELMALLTKKFGGLPEPDRWGMVQDLYAFALSGDATVDEYLKMVELSNGETSSLVVGELAGEITTLSQILHGNEKARSTFLKFITSQIERIGRTPRSGEADTVKTLRERLSWSLVLMDESYARELAKEFSRYDGSAPELRGAICMAYARLGGKEEHEELARRFSNAQNESETRNMAAGLMCFPQQDLLNSSLDMVFDPKTGMGKGLQLMSGAFSVAIATPEGRAVVWSWFVKNLDKLIRATQGSPLLSGMLQYYLPGGGLGREEEVRKEMTARTIPQGESGKAKGLELLSVYEKLYRSQPRTT
jgi:tricorn protease interacting factor F2/3